MLREESQKRVLEVREVDGLVRDRNLIGCQIDDHVLDDDHLNPLAPPRVAQQEPHARPAFDGGRVVHHEIARHAMRQLQPFDVRLVDDGQKRASPALDEQPDFFQMLPSRSARLENDQVGIGARAQEPL